MLSYEEERVAAFRLRLELAGFPSLEDTEALADYLDGCVRVVDDRTLSRACCIRFPSGAALILLPAGLDRRSRDAALLEELAHYLCTEDRTAILAASCRESHADPARMERWRRRWESKLERSAADFCLAWRLPRDLLAEGISDAEIAYETGLPFETIQIRRQQLLGSSAAHGLTAPPAWSARRHYRLWRRTGPLPTLRLVPAHADFPTFALPAPSTEAESLRRALSADLWALSPAELALRHARWKEEPEQECTLDFDEPAARARDVRWSGAARAGGLAG